MNSIIGLEDEWMDGIMDLSQIATDYSFLCGTVGFFFLVVQPKELRNLFNPLCFIV